MNDITVDWINVKDRLPEGSCFVHILENDVGSHFKDGVYMAIMWFDYMTNEFGNYKRAYNGLKEDLIFWQKTKVSSWAHIDKPVNKK